MTPRPPLLPEITPLVQRPTRLLIDGDWSQSRAGEVFPTLDPSTGQEICRVARGTEADVDAAVDAAGRAAQGLWRTMSPDRRGTIIWAIAEVIDRHAEELAQLESLDSGKPIAVTRASDLPAVSEVFRYYAGWVTKIAGDVRRTSVPRTLGYTLRQPVGVCGLIIPWNYPLLMAAWKLAPALAAGCTMVLKPSEFTSLSAVRLGELLAEVGLPDGVVNIVTGFGSEAGAALARHPRVDKVAFTGSPRVGRQVLASSSDSNLKRVTLELGGKSPHIVFADSDLLSAKEAVTRGIFANMGQNCTAGSRVLVERAVYDEVVEHLASHADGLVVGDGMLESTQIGPLVNARQRDQVQAYVDLGVTEGARLASARGLPDELCSSGFFVRPAVLADARNEMRICQEEIFGPVVAVLPFDSEESAVAMANDTPYGLAAGVWTSDLARTHRMVEALDVGVVWVNTYNSTDPAMPFGGFGQSGIGRELGPEGLDAYLETKSVVVCHRR